MPPNISTMEECVTTKGVFLYSRHLDSELMVKCLQAMLNNFPKIKFTSVVADESFVGYRVHFSAPNEEAVLAQKYLIVSGQTIRICALTTCLTIHNISLNGDVQLENDIRDAISDRFGKLLNFFRVPGSPNRQNGNTCYICRVCVDVPEIKDLRIFDHDGLPEMRVCLRNKKETLKVTFWCTQCKKDGHIKEDCLQVMQPNTNSEDERIISTDSENATTRPVMKIKIPHEWTDIYAQKIGREEIIKAGIFSEGNRNDKEAGSSKATPEAMKPKENNLTTFPAMGIKMEIDDDDKSEIKGTYQNNGDNTKAKEPEKKVPNMHQGSDDGDSNSRLDDDIQFIGFSNSNSANEHQKPSIKRERRAEARNSDEELSSPPARPVDSSFTSSAFATLLQSSSTYTPRSTRPSIAVEITSVLSEQLQDCINRACEEIGVLNRQKLDAFLIHVKKKSNPIRVASNYTDNAPKLKEQLQQILKIFYNTPQTGTKEDTQFIKWLNGLVERFEGTVPRKRKRGGNSDDTIKKK